MNTQTLINHLPTNPSAPTAWDSTVYERAFTESPTEQLHGGLSSIGVLTIALAQPEFRDTITEIAMDDDMEVFDVIASLHRTLSFYATVSNPSPVIRRATNVDALERALSRLFS